MKSVLRSACGAALAVLGLSAAVAADPVLAPRSNSAQGVTIRVTPKALAAGAPAWEFSVDLDTHSVSLDDDLKKSAVLLDDAGGRHAPVSWQGPAPGGHHRAGLLRFKPLVPQPKEIELQIARPGEAAPRSFRWSLR